MMTPQLTEQYGQVLRVSVVREIFSVLDWAKIGATSKPNAERAAPPAIELRRNVRRDIPIGRLQCEGRNCKQYTSSKAAPALAALRASTLWGPPSGGRQRCDRDTSEAQQIQLDLLVAVLEGPHVERRSSDLVHERNRQAESADVHAFQIAATTVAGIDSHVLE